MLRWKKSRHGEACHIGDIEICSSLASLVSYRRRPKRRDALADPSACQQKQVFNVSGTNGDLRRCKMSEETSADVGLWMRASTSGAGELISHLARAGVTPPPASDRRRSRTKRRVRTSLFWPRTRNERAVNSEAVHERRPRHRNQLADA